MNINGAIITERTQKRNFERQWKKWGNIEIPRDLFFLICLVSDKLLLKKLSVIFNYFSVESFL